MAQDKIPVVLRLGNSVLVFVQELLNKVFAPSMNPMYYLGAITFFLFWIILISGAYLLLFYEINPVGAYESIEYIMNEQKYYGGIMRSLHRYASDGLMVVVVLHIFQTVFSDRFRNYRWVAWVTGVIILILIWLDGITGYFLVWDMKAQMLSKSLSELLDALPFFSQPISRNFIYNTSVSPTLFFVITFLHITIPSALGVMAWVHCMRISKPLINPPRQVAVAIVALLVGISLVKPASSVAPLDMMSMPGKMEIDWFYLFPFPLVDMINIPASWVWILLTAGFTLFVLLPWLIKSPPKPPASEVEKPHIIPMGIPQLEVDKCTGCNLCLESCPFEAINVIPRTDSSDYETQIEIVDERCAQSGFCVAACPTHALTIGDFSKTTFGQKVHEIFAAKGTGEEADDEDRPEIMVYFCERSMDLSAVLTPDLSRFAENDAVAVTVIPCIGFLNIAIIESTLESGAKGVIGVGCRSLDCHHREGRCRTEGGFSTEQVRFPVEEMGREDVKVLLVSRFGVTKLLEDIDEFIDSLKEES